VLLSLLIGGIAWGADAPMTYIAYRNPVAPVMDGVIAGDPGWANIPGATGYHQLGDGYTNAKQTAAYVTWDAEALYVGIVAEEPDIAKVHGTMPEGGDCWLDDGVEIFIQAPGREPCQFIVTNSGARASGAGNPGLSGWTAKTSRTADSYSVEIRIGFVLFGATPKPGDEWHANYCRNIFTMDSGGDRFTSWAPLQARFLEPEGFPVLRFEAKALDETGCRQAEAALNGGYRDSLMQGLAGLAKEADDYLPVLTKAAQSPANRALAGELKTRWVQALELQKAAAQAPLPQVRKVLRTAEELRKQSYELKYRMLIEELFEG
jgi:hypothetical protein